MKIIKLELGLIAAIGLKGIKIENVTNNKDSDTDGPKEKK